MVKVPFDATVASRCTHPLSPRSRRPTSTRAPALAPWTRPRRRITALRLTVRRAAPSVTFEASPRSPPEVVKRSWLPSAIRKASFAPALARPSAVGVSLETSWGRQLRPPSVVRSR